MEQGLNVTYLALDGHVGVHEFRYLYFVLVLIVYVLILCSNCTVVYLIWKQPDLHEPMYVFIAALLLNSVLLSTNIYPKLLLDFLSDTQIISFSACLFQFVTLYSLVDSEFLLLAAMAYDRYVSICRPLHYQSIMRRNVVGILLALSWLLPACQFAGLAAMRVNQKLCRFSLKVIFCNNSMYKLFCETSAAVSFYGVFVLINLSLCPVIFIVFTYTRILLICYRSSADVRRKAAHTCLPHLLVLSNYFFLITFDVITVRLEADIPHIPRLIMTLQFVVYNPLFNPVIYGLKMKEISKHLKKLLFQRNIADTQ
ncbi:olfactory receptor 5H6-like [Betta splendens]|uniref:Olfactory receptor n=1 Tax=Betta splendens TaxID=158456 RepID=A0A6P7LCC0_BETSP|nr:olfactory receptor 5H6-like [Betta splendens]